MFFKILVTPGLLKDYLTVHSDNFFLSKGLYLTVFGLLSVEKKFVFWP